MKITLETAPRGMRYFGVDTDTAQEYELYVGDKIEVTKAMRLRIIRRDGETFLVR